MQTVGRKENKRLVALPFIERYRNIAQKGATVHLKTDNEELFAFALEQVSEHKYPLKVSSDNVYEDAKKLGPEKYALLTEIQTYYEKLFLSAGSKIHYMEFSI